MSPGAGRLEKFHDAAVFVCLLISIVCVPIPLGSNRPFAWYGLEIFVYAVLGLHLLGAVVHGVPKRAPRSAIVVVFILVAWLGFILLQTISLPGEVVRALNPLIYKLQQNLALIGVRADNTISVDPGTTYDQFLKYGCYIALFYLTLTTVNTRTRLLWLIGIVVAAGVLEAMFGLYSAATGFVVFPETHGGHELRAGTFVNRTHFANFLMMALGLVFGIVASIVNAQEPQKRLKIREYGSVRLAVLALMVTSAVVLLVGIFIVGSRPTILLFGVAFGAALVGALVLRRGAAGELALAPLVVVCVAAAIILISLHNGTVSFTEGGVSREEQVLQNASGLKLLGAVWLTGVGAGNYRWVFPMFRGGGLRFATYEHAHNDFLEAAIDEGIPVVTILGLGVFLIMRQLCKGYRKRRNPLMRGVIFGCLVSMTFMLLHATVGFSFHIPANAVYFFVIAAAGMAATRIDHTRRAAPEAATGPGVSA